MTDSHPDTLLPCPFCAVELRKMSEGQGYLHPKGNCPLADFHMEADGYSEARWNTRPQPPAPLEGCMSGWEVAPAPQDDLRVSDALALEGYRAAVSFISADSWDGCSDCIEILRAARATDVLHYWTPNDAALAIQDLRSRYRGQSPSAAFDRATLALAPQDELVEEVSAQLDPSTMQRLNNWLAPIIAERDAALAERERQYDENVSLICQMAAAEAALEQIAAMPLTVQDGPCAVYIAREALATEKQP